MQFKRVRIGYDIVFRFKQITFLQSIIQKPTCPSRAIWDKIKASLDTMQFEYLKFQIYRVIKIPENENINIK